MNTSVAIAILIVLFTVGVNFLLWGLVGVLRFVHERVGTRHGTPSGDGPPASRVAPDRLAVLMAAHNEEAVIADALAALTAVVPPDNVYVASDGSTDRTLDLAQQAGVQVLDVQPNRGKAGALRAAIEHFGLLDRYGAVLFLDADTHLDPGYLDAGLRWFDDPQVAAVAGYAKPLWEPRGRPWMANLVAVHRHRLYAVTQMLQKYGQTWRYTNVTYIAPGFASMYRTDALRSIDMDPPGLVIEDFNMTFEIHRRGLGRIALTPGALARCHEPHTYRDYVSQTRRWVLGFWQTVRRHGVWASSFWAALALWIVEIVVASAFFLLLPAVFVLLLVGELWPAMATVPAIGEVYEAVAARVSLAVLTAAVLLPDVVITSVLAIRDRRPRYPLLALALPLLRVTDAFIGLVTIPKAWTETSTGAWTSPSRV